MARSGPDQVVSLQAERERTIDLLGQHFAQDNLSLEELEHRIEQAYRAPDVPALREITKDLPSASAEKAVTVPRARPDVDVFAPEEGRIFSFMGQTRRRGVWQPPKLLTLISIMSETTLDFTQAMLSPGVTEVEVKGLMTQIKVIVPPGVRVVTQPSAFMAEVSDDPHDPPPVGSGAPVIRITGFVMMAELKVTVRRRELPEEIEDA
jgi:hypothetical protein